MTYAEKLKDPRWQKKRLEILARDGFRCQMCRDGEKTLHVHHVNYRPNTAPWEYEDEELETLCEDCHELVKAVQARVNRRICLRDEALCFALLCKILEDGGCREMFSILSDLADNQTLTVALYELLKCAPFNPSVPLLDTTKVPHTQSQGSETVLELSKT